MNDVTEVSLRIPRLGEGLGVAFIVKRSCPYFVVPSVPKGDFGFPVIPSVPMRRLDQSGRLPSYTEVRGDIDLIDLVLARPSVTSYLNRSTCFDDHFRLRFGDE